MVLFVCQSVADSWQLQFANSYITDIQLIGKEGSNPCLSAERGFLMKPLFFWYISNPFFFIFKWLCDRIPSMVGVR